MIIELPIVLIFILGAIIGSFLNVVIYRYHTGPSLWQALGGRSQCLSCGQTLRWFELLPVFSFFFLLGKCRRCGSILSWQYPLVELGTGLLFVFIWNLQLPLPNAILYYLSFCLLVVITAYDLRHKIIPDAFVFSFIALALLNLLIQTVSFSPLSVAWLALSYGLLAGAIPALFLWLLWALGRGRWMGFGDVKLALGVGLFAGLNGGISALVLAFWLGAIVGLALIAVAKLKPRGLAFGFKSEVPFAPFIIAGLVLVIFYNFHVLPF